MESETLAAKVKDNNCWSCRVLSRLFLFLCASIFIGAGILGYEVYLPHTTFTGKRIVEIPAGAGTRQIADILKKEGVIRSKTTFLFYVVLIGEAGKLKSGTYAFFPSSTVRIIRDLVAGANQERMLFVPEGWNLKELAQAVEDQFDISEEDFLRSAAPPFSSALVKEFSFLQELPDNATLEGFLFPDTYRFFSQARAEDILDKMLDNFSKKVAVPLENDHRIQKKTLFEIITMASLIEKEVAIDKDRMLVSGILWKRLDVGLPLQVDATIVYITGKRTTQISRDETKIDSPYNTYRYQGLPIGPIANPGLSAIRAALFPESSPYFYYLSTKERTTIFSRTLEEHNRAKAKFLQ